MTRNSRTSWLRWGAVAAPVALIGVFVAANRISGPRPAEASNATTPQAAGLAPVAPLKEVQSVEMWIMEHPATATSPFLAAPVAVIAQEADEVESPVAPVLEGIKLSSVFSANGASIASINGKLYRPGQEVRPGVTVASIDARARKVVLQLSDGREVELTAGRKSTQRELDAE